MKYNGLFWGFLFLFDFRLGGYDILPDSIGYLIMAVAFGNLAAESKYFDKGKRLSIILAVVSIVDFVSFGAVGEATYTMSTMFMLVVWFLNAKLVQLICTGIAAEARDHAQNVLEEKAHSRWKYYRILVIATPFMMVTTVFLPALAQLLIIPLFIYTVVVLVMMMLFMKQAESTLP